MPQSGEPKKTRTRVPFAAGGGLLGPQALVPSGQKRLFCKIRRLQPTSLQLACRF